jgi:hypothetical protein
MEKSDVSPDASPRKVSRNVQSFRGHGAIVDRIKKSLYYGKVKENREVMDCPSLPLTEATVEMFEQALKQKYNGPRGLDVFDLNYASMVSEKACISPCSVVLAIIYIDRLKNKNPDYLKTVSPCDLFLVSMLVASKYLFDDGEDEEVFNDEWAASGALELKELNRHEREFLGAMDWDLYVDPSTFFRQLTDIETLVTWNETRRRVPHGFTYNELVSLSFDSKTFASWLNFSEDFFKMIVITSVTYSAIVLSVFGATIVACSFHGLLSKSLTAQTSTVNMTNVEPPMMPFDLSSVKTLTSFLNPYLDNSNMYNRFRQPEPCLVLDQATEAGFPNSFQQPIFPREHTTSSFSFKMRKSPRKFPRNECPPFIPILVS